MNIDYADVLLIMELWQSYRMQYVTKYACFYFVCCGVFSAAH